MIENPTAPPDDPKELLRRLEQAERAIELLRAGMQRGVETLGVQIGDLSGRVDGESMRRPKTDPRRPFFIANITDQDEESHAWAEQYVTGAGFVSFARTSGDTAHTSAAIELNGWLNVPTDQLALMLEYPIVGERKYAFAFTPPPPPDQTGTIDYVATYTDGVWTWVEIEECDEAADTDDGEVV